MHHARHCFQHQIGLFAKHCHEQQVAPRLHAWNLCKEPYVQVQHLPACICRCLTRLSPLAWLRAHRLLAQHLLDKHTSASTLMHSETDSSPLTAVMGVQGRSKDDATAPTANSLQELCESCIQDASVADTVLRKLQSLSFDMRSIKCLTSSRLEKILDTHLGPALAIAARLKLKDK